MVNHAFDSDNRIATQEWMDNRMYLVTRAENMLRGLPFSKSEPLPLIFLFNFKLCSLTQYSLHFSLQSTDR